MESSCWATLPKHLLDSVLYRLPSRSDYLRFSVVCMSWNSVTKDNLSKRTIPMLLTYTGKEDTWHLYDIASEKVLNLQLDLSNRRFCGFSKEWLITVDKNFIVTLINPFSRVKGRKVEENSIIKCPAETNRRPWGNQKLYRYYVHKATISANPVSKAKDCIVMIIHGIRCQLAFIRLNIDTRWTYIDESIRHILDVIYVEDKFYALNQFNQLFSVEVTAEGFKSCLVGEALDEEEPLSCIKNRYLVDLSDHKELLMVHRFMSYTGPPRSRRWTTKFEVFKFDFVKYKWMEINNLGDNAIFVGENSSLSVLASHFRCVPNCIYFLHDWDHQFPPRRPRDSGVYDITNHRFLRLGLARTLIKMSNQTPIWTMGSITL